MRTEFACASLITVAGSKEAVTFKQTTVQHKERKISLRERSVFAMDRKTKPASHALVLLAFLACFGLPQLQASTPEVAQKLISGRSARTVPHRFTIVPNDVSLTPNQMQHFGVTDAQGNPVAVHWNVSGLHCAGLACGNIDADGNYSSPASLSQPIEITLEGVVVSDPNYSVMTRIQIVPATKVSSSPIEASSSPTRVPAPPVIEKNVVTPSHELPLNQPVTPAPTVASSAVRQQTQPPTNVIADAPSVDARASASPSAASVLPLPTAVAAAPALSTSTGSERKAAPPLPNAVAAAPVVKDKGRNSTPGTIMLALPAAVAAMPVVKKPVDSVTRSQPVAVAAVPAAPTVTNPVRQESAPLPAAVAPAATAAPRTPVTTANLAPSPGVVGTQPMLAKPQAPIKQDVVPQPQVIAVTPTTETRVATTSAAMALAPATPATPAPTIVPSPAGTTVTYRDGLLKIDAENITLAAVLKLVATKMGAVIDVPPGSGEERIVEHVGPGHPNDVLTQLLNGSHFNFIIVNSPQHPNEPAQVLLSLESHDASTPVAAAAPPQPAAAASVYWTPPDPTLRPQPLPPQYDSTLTAPPRESLTPESISELMRAKARELRERAQQQGQQDAPPQQPQQQPPPPAPSQPQQPPQE